MTVCWADTETCGIDPIDSAPFEIAFLIYRGGECAAEKLFRLNPLGNGIAFHEDAYRVNGVPEEEIRSFPPAKEAVPGIAEFLKPYAEQEKMVFAGYNCKFDYGHIEALFKKEGLSMTDYFSGRLIDVYELVKRASAKGLLPKTENQKLETVAKSLGIAHDEAHSALSDIKATRRLYESIYRIEKERL
jgi:DNA polymerase III epsilon subunit-like protein